MPEINPNHPVTQQLRGQWHKVLAMLMLKLGVTEIVLTNEDANALLSIEGMAVVANSKPDGLHLSLVSEAEAQRLARTADGRSN